ncbi:uncharacterized protein K02A2.6-like [Pollicipes pollicipes]|uniref:uncharacterized protein K02A2.6-like n=1 Tax=Pollicipes pollicipes TaxID=41117 RepID=UPI0018851BF8|nr:uncharacterized protein K02A2.6-like [Pollicipes pollicipes]
MRYTGVPFGLVSSGSAFQKLLSSLLEGIPGCGHYPDDILVSGKDHQEHDARLRQVLDSLARSNVTINQAKSVFRQTTTEFCGHKLSSAGVVPVTSTFRAVVKAPPPTNVRELRSFLGTNGWFSRFVPGHATVVRPMADLLKKGTTFQWTQEQQLAFSNVKQLTSTSPVMQPFDPHLPTVVTSDASDRGAGAVLTQIQRAVPAPLPDTAGAEPDDDDIIALVTDAAADVLPDAEIQAASEADPALKELRDDDIILRGPDRVVVPVALTDKYLQVAHQSHEGIVRTKQLLRNLAWWPGMTRAITDLIRDCQTCRTKEAVLSQSAPPSARYAITVIDYASKWPRVALTPSAETDDVISLLGTMWSREGYCDEVVSDNGPQFTSAKFEKYLSDRGIHHRKSSLYWPRGNAAIERFNRTLKTWLLEATQQPSRTAQAFAAHIKRRLELYRAAPHCTTGIPPSGSLHGRRMRPDLPVMSANATDADMRTCVQKQQRRNARNYNRRRGVKKSTIRPGDMVRVRRPGHTPKNLSRFGATQTVVRRVGSATFLLSDGTRWSAAHLAAVPATSPAVTPDGDS